MAQISRNWADLVKRARAKQLAPDEFQSGTFTISNLGNFGADIFDAILPPGRTPAGMQGTPSMMLCCQAAMQMSDHNGRLGLAREHCQTGTMLIFHFLAVLQWLCQGM